MRELITFILMTLLLFTQVLYVPLTALSFELNRDFIARNLCINKSNPDSPCKGCCYLKKEIEQNRAHQSSNSGQEDKLTQLWSYYAEESISLNTLRLYYLLLYPESNAITGSYFKCPVKPPESEIV